MPRQKQKRRNPDSLAEVFGRRLTEVRKSRQMSQQEMADKIGMSRSLLAYYEATAENPNFEIVERVAKFFEIPPQHLLTDPEEDKKSGPPSRLEQQMSKIKDLTPYKQRMISDIIDVTMNAK